ncbi:10808_t:CDS:10, partial [Acaulospora morrowiae]
MDSWNEVLTACDPNINVVQSISAIAFDPYQELLWTGNDKGRVASYFGESLQRYTSFRSHLTPVEQLLVSDKGVISLSSDSVKMTNRRGLVKWVISNEDTTNLHCMTYTTMPNSEILAAGRQQNMLVINVARGTVVKKVESESEIVVMRKSRLVCCGSTSGEVTLRDPRTLKVEHRIQAHTGTISDIDTMGNLLLTCDPLVKLYDVRTMRPLVPMSFPSGPCFLKMHPKLSTTVFIMSRSGQFHVCDVGNASGTHFYQANASYINAIDLSTSGEMLAFGDAVSMIHLWSDRKSSKINAYSNPVELPAVPDSTSKVVVGENDSLSLVGMPYYREPLLSVWPSSMVFEVGNPSPKIDPEILSSMKMIDFVGYAPNPGYQRRNQVFRWSRKERKSGAPKFVSEKERELQSGKGSKQEPLSLSEGEAELDATSTRMPKYYRRVEIKYSRFGVDDFDFEFYNKTHYAGLETHITNSYCNSLLQVLFFIPVLRLITKSHIGSTCSKENCLCCELGFLFRMLEDARGRNCQASNFLRAFSTIPQASALGLFEPEEPDEKTTYSLLIQNFNRFILEQLHQECNSENNPRLLKSLPLEKTSLSMIQQLLGMQMVSTSLCKCETRTERHTIPFVVDLNYSSNNSKGKGSSTKSFVDVLRSSIQRETQPKAWCNKCQQYVPTIAKKIPKGLPPILSVNCGLGTTTLSEFWRSPDGNNPWLPKRISMSIDQDDLNIAEIETSTAIDISYTGNPNHANYELMAIVIQVKVEKEIPHLVAFVKVSKELETESSGKGPWYLFNDFLVKNVSEQEVFNFQGSWKTPVLLYYSRVDISDLMDTSVLPSEIDKSILFKDISISKHRDTNIKSAHLLTPEELPQPGTLVAIDAEFVALNQEETEIRSDGTKSVIRPRRLSLARVSVLRGEGARENHPFIDDYIAASEPVVDYLTEFSGIQAGDLDQQSSKHTLVAYKKLRLLLDLGCIFVGHGLKKDFRIINILVPSNQVIDTVDIFHIKNRARKISLRFLAWYLLRQDIQTDTHDSIEDARTALAIYKKYLQFKSEGIFEE